MSVQNHWRIYFFFSTRKIFTQFLEFYPQGKLHFYFSFEPICIFQFSGKRKNAKLDSNFTVSAQKPQKRLGPFLFARVGRTQAATSAWAGKVPRACSPAWAMTWPIQSRPSIHIRRPSAHLARIKADAARP